MKNYLSTVLVATLAVTMYVQHTLSLVTTGQYNYNYTANNVIV